MVKDARNRLLAADQRVSIDAIRAELGHTGSKTTIHKHLKDLEQEETSILDQERHLRDSLTSIVAKLASTLSEEAQAAIDKAEETFSQQLEHFQDLLADKMQDYELLAEQAQYLESQKNQIETALDQTRKDLSQSEQRAIRVEGENKLLSTQLEERAGHIDTLEARYQQIRESLDHFRASSKQQRDQERHVADQQIQQLQLDMKTANHTALESQEIIRTLTGEKATIAAQLAGANQRLEGLSQDLSRTKSANQKLSKANLDKENELLRLRPSIKRLEALEDQLSDCKSQLEAKNQQAASLQTANVTLARAMEMLRPDLSELNQQKEQE